MRIIPNEFTDAPYEALLWLTIQPDLKTAYDNCNKPSWLMWGAYRLNLIDKPTSIKIAIECAELVQPNVSNENKEIVNDAINISKIWLQDQNETNRLAAVKIAKMAGLADKPLNNRFQLFAEYAAYYTVLAAALAENNAIFSAACATIYTVLDINDENKIAQIVKKYIKL